MKQMLFHKEEFNNLNNYQIADIIKNLKVNYGLTSHFLAQEIKTSETNLSQWINHKKQMSAASRDNVLSMLWARWIPVILVYHFNNRDTYWVCGDIKDPFLTHFVPKNLTPAEIEKENKIIEHIKKRVEEEKPKYEIFHTYKNSLIAGVVGVDDEYYCNQQVFFGASPILLWSDIIMNERWKDNPGLLVRPIGAGL